VMLQATAADARVCTEYIGYNTRITPAEQKLLSQITNSSQSFDSDVSDVDLWELPDGTTLFCYLFGNQNNEIFSALGRYHGTMASWFRGQYSVGTTEHSVGTTVGTTAGLLRNATAVQTSVCASNPQNSTFWDHTKCASGNSTNACCETVWGPRNSEECCQNCQSSAFGFECVAWEWYDAGADCYVCSKEVLAHRGQMDGHVTGCLKGLC
jgi:hypothetical protein